MNFIDLIVLLILIFALYNGWKDGAIMQLCSILSILVGVWLASHYGALVGDMLHMGSNYSMVGGFLVVMVAVIIAAALVSRILRKIFSAVGLGGVDILLGIVISVCKFAVILSVLFGAFDGLNKNLDLVESKTLDESKLYRPIIKISSSIFPALDWTKKQISSGIEKL